MVQTGVFKRRWVRLSLAGALVAAVLLATLAWAMTGPLGRTLLSAAVNGRDAGGYGVIEIGDVGGDILSDFSVGHVQLRDRGGVWLRLEDARVKWRAASVFSATVEIAHLEIGRVEILRRPVRGAVDDAAGAAAPAIQIDQLILERLTLAQGVAGPAATYTMTGHLRREADLTLALGADAARIDQVGDRLQLQLDRLSDGALTGDIFIQAPPGGPLAELLRLGDLGWSLEGELGGTLQSGDAGLELKIGDATASQGSLGWLDGGWTLHASLHPELWPDFPAAAASLSANARLESQGDMSPLTIREVYVQSEGLEW